MPYAPEGFKSSGADHDYSPTVERSSADRVSVGSLQHEGALMSFFAGEPDRLERFRAGDRDVLSDVYRHYVGPLSHVLRQGFSVTTPERVVHVPGLSSLHEIECAGQEVFLRAFQPKARLGYDGVRSFGNYLFRIARNFRIDEFRRRGLVVSGTPVEDLNVPDAVLPVDQQLVSNELDAMIKAFLSVVPERDRRYMGLRFEGGLAQTDAAAELGLTRIQGRRIEARIKLGLLAYLRERGYRGGRS